MGCQEVTTMIILYIFLIQEPEKIPKGGQDIKGKGGPVIRAGVAIRLKGRKKDDDEEVWETELSSKSAVTTHDFTGSNREL